MKLFYTEHALIRMQERNINKAMIEKAVATGEMVEGNKKKTFMVITKDLFVIITFSSNKRTSARVHTVYRPTEYQLDKRQTA